MSDSLHPNDSGLRRAYGHELPDLAALLADMVAAKLADMAGRLARLEVRQARTEGDRGTFEARLDRMERLVLKDDCHGEVS